VVLARKGESGPTSDGALGRADERTAYGSGS
jgi:hypothetical protein